MGSLRALAAGRRAAERKMHDTCTIVRPGEESTDEDGDVTTPSTAVYGTVLEPGKCNVATYEAQESNPEAGGATLTVQRYRFDVPVGSCVPAIGDVATIQTAAADPNLPGRRYRVVALLHKSKATAYRLGVEEVVTDG